MNSSVWVYKCNRKEQSFARAFGDWNDVFRNSKTKQWGGSWCTGNPVSKNIMNEKMGKGDLVLAYQTNDRTLVGVCRLERITGQRNERILYMKPLHRFDRPIPIQDLKESLPKLREISAFQPGFPQTVYGLSTRERRVLERYCDINLDVGPKEPALPPKKRNTGAGFGNAETNRKVERAAVKWVSDWYSEKGFRVESVEHLRRHGYDLRCVKEAREEYVEVKGVAGSEPSFIITEWEYNQSKTNRDFIICVVTNALSNAPKMQRYTGVQLSQRFKFRPLQYCACPN